MNKSFVGFVCAMLMASPSLAQVPYKSFTISGTGGASRDADVSDLKFLWVDTTGTVPPSTLAT